MKAIVSSSRQELYALTSEEFVDIVAEAFEDSNIIDIDFPGSGNRIIKDVTYYFTVVRSSTKVDYFMINKAFDNQGRILDLKEAKRRFFESL